MFFRIQVLFENVFPPQHIYSSNCSKQLFTSTLKLNFSQVVIYILLTVVVPLPSSVVYSFHIKMCSKIFSFSLEKSIKYIPKVLRFPFLLSLFFHFMPFQTKHP